MGSQISRLQLEDPGQDHRFTLTWAAGRHQLAEGGNGRHAHQTAQPNDGDDLVGVVDRLPGARPQRMADGVVALAGYGHQGPGGDGHGGSCKKYGV